MLDDLSKLEKKEIESAVEIIEALESGDEEILKDKTDYFYGKESGVVGQLKHPDSYKIERGDRIPEAETIWEAKKEDVLKEAEERDIETGKTR